MNTTPQRLFYLDYLRGFMVFLVVIDHAMHGYTRYFNHFWFIQDQSTSLFLDVLHMHNDAVMMPFMFFLAGLFTFHSLERHGAMAYLKERMIRLGLPLLFGILFITPFMAFDKAKIKDSSLQFIDFWQSIILDYDVYPLDRGSASGFWFLTYLLLLTLVVTFLYHFFPGLRRAMGRFASWVLCKPIKGLMTLFLLIAFMNSISDWLWGHPLWFVVKPFFGVRRARFMVKIFFFLMGIAFYDAGLTKNPDLLSRLKASWKILALLALGILAVYVSFTLTYAEDGAFALPIYAYFYHFNTYPSPDIAWILITGEGLLSSIRVLLLSGALLSLSCFYLSFFARFLNRPITLLVSLAASSYGIYVIHEPLVTLMNRWLLEEAFAAEIKFALAALVSLGISWPFVHFGLLKIPLIKRIIG